MSRNSSKQMYTQLMEWLPTLKSKRSKSAKSSIHAASTTNTFNRDNDMDNLTHSTTASDGPRFIKGMKR
jgi:hypothetical protein